MNIQDFTYLINNPTQISKEHTKQLEDVISTFPYFQSARALYLKGLKNQNSFKYNQTLKTTAAYTTDRSILFNLITSSLFTDDTSMKELEVIDAESVEAIHKKVTESFTPKEKESIIKLDIGKPIEFKQEEAYSFNEWLQLSSFKPIKRQKKQVKEEPKKDLIDTFIEENPKIKPLKKGAETTNEIKHVPLDYSNLMTETLAKVYLEQKKYDNAIKAYRILSLKYPEKSSFFADRIKAIKLLDKK